MVLNMTRKSKLLTDEVANFAKGALAKIGGNTSIAIKLKAVISAYEHGITDVAKIFGVTKTTLISWIKYVKNEKVDLLEVAEGRGRKSVIDDYHREIIKKWLLKDSQLTIDQIRQKLIDECDITPGRSSVHRAIKLLDFSYITPRPKHYKQPENSLEEAKKKSSK